MPHWALLFATHWPSRPATSQRKHSFNLPAPFAPGAPLSNESRQSVAQRRKIDVDKPAIFAAAATLHAERRNALRSQRAHLSLHCRVSVQFQTNCRPTKHKETYIDFQTSAAGRASRAGRAASLSRAVGVANLQENTQRNQSQ